MADNCVLGTKNETKIKDVERRMGIVEQAVLDIREKLIGRPSWTVVFIITTLTSSSLAMATAIIMLLKT